MVTEEKTAMLPAWLHWALLSVGAAIGMGLAFWLGAPEEWEENTPQVLGLTLTCIATAYALLVAWEKELTDGADVAVIKRMVELATPVVLLGAAGTSVGLTFTAGGTSNVGPLFGMLVITLVGVAGLVLAAKRINRPANPANGTELSSNP